MRTRALRRSLASATRVTMPASVRLATILVMVGRLHLFDGRQLPQGRAAVPADRAERRGLRRREAPERLLAEAPLQPVHGDAQAAGHLFVGQLDGLRGACAHYS